MRFTKSGWLTLSGLLSINLGASARPYEGWANLAGGGESIGGYGALPRTEYFDALRGAIG